MKRSEMVVGQTYEGGRGKRQTHRKIVWHYPPTGCYGEEFLVEEENGTRVRVSCDSFSRWAKRAVASTEPAAVTKT